MNNKTTIKREILTGVQYLLIGAIAATWALRKHNMLVWGFKDNFDSSGSINVVGTLQSWWGDYLSYWVYMFIGLSAIRLLIGLIVQSYWYHKQK